jgi:hypothetical protein
MLHAQACPRTLGLVRIIVFAMWWLRVFQVPIERMAIVPVELLKPAGVLAILPEPFWNAMWTPTSLWTLKILLLLCLAALVLGMRYFQPMALLTCILLTLYQGMPCSFGFVNHAEIAPLYAAYILAVFPSADGLSLSVRKHPPRPAAVYRASILAITLVFLLTYSLVAIRRLCLGGPKIFFDDTILYQIAGGGVVSPASLGLNAIQNPLLVFVLRAGFPIVTLHELLSPLCLFSRYFRWTWKAVMIPFHIATWITMGLAFPMSLVLIAVVLSDLDWLLKFTSLHRYGPIKISKA